MNGWFDTDDSYYFDQNGNCTSGHSHLTAELSSLTLPALSASVLYQVSYLSAIPFLSINAFRLRNVKIVHCEDWNQGFMLSIVFNFGYGIFSIFSGKLYSSRLVSRALKRCLLFMENTCSHSISMKVYFTYECFPWEVCISKIVLFC